VSRPRILIVDDEADIRSSLKMILEYEEMEPLEAADGKQALAMIEKSPPDAMLLDIKMQGMDGLEVLAELRRREVQFPVVMVSGHGTITTAVEATRLGAFDFMEKPLERDRVLLVLRNALDKKRLLDEVREYRSDVEERFQLIGKSDVLGEIQKEVARVAPTQASVLITGESGTGKELVARAVHRNSRRADKPFVKVNCAAIPEELIESELFGHVKGSFTGATRDQDGKFVRANGGTIFLDEIGDMSLKTQAKVLRALQDGDIEPVGAAKTVHVDVRVVAATNKDLPTEIEAGQFREDLYFRLNVVPLEIPPLRERRGDIGLLVNHFAHGFSVENNSPKKSFSKEALAALSEMPWRGNVRELRNAVERLLIMSRGSNVELSDLPTGMGMALNEAAQPSTAGTLPVRHEGATLQQFKEEAERRYLVTKLLENDWNVAATAKSIETPRSNLYKKLEAYAIDREKDGES
jgi:two-component system nitrogen regulation response regulator NtrX